MTQGAFEELLRVLGHPVRRKDAGGSMTHADLVARAARWLRNSRHCPWVLTEARAGYSFSETPDAIGWDRRGRSHLVECKMSAEDYARDSRKSFRRVSGLGMGVLRWYLMPKVLAESGLLLPDYWGLIYPQGRIIVVAREATPQERHANEEISLLLRRFTRCAE